MASVAKQVLVDTRTGRRGNRSCSWNHRQDDFTLFAKLTGKPVKSVKLKVETSPNGEDWDELTEPLELENDGQTLFHDIKRNMLTHFQVSYDDSALKRVTGKGKDKKEEKVADLHFEVCYRDKK